MAPALFVGALVNAAAVAGAVTRMLQATGGCITVVPCGERWDPPGEDGPLRVAVEDLLGAGAILSHLTCDKSPEARACEGAFLSLRGALDEVLWECASGRQLREHGFGEDVRHAAKLDAIGCAPVLRDEAADHDRMMAEFEQFDRELGIRSSAGSPPETVRGLLEQARAALGSPPDP